MGTGGHDGKSGLGPTEVITQPWSQHLGLCLARGRCSGHLCHENELVKGAFNQNRDLESSQEILNKEFCPWSLPFLRTTASHFKF